MTMNNDAMSAPAATSPNTMPTPALTASVGYWATLSLNIPDFTRYAYSQKDQIIGQTLGLPTTMTLIAFIGVAVTMATTVIYGEAIWDPVAVIAKFDSKALSAAALVTLAIAVLTVSVHAFRAASTDPVQALRYE